MERMLDPRWHTFLTLCETINYTRAAEKLCLTQPAVTHHIQYLESHYHCKLFRYEGKVLFLTEAGRKLRDYTRSMAYNSTKVEEAMAADGLGVSFLYAPAAARELAAGTLARFDLANVPLHEAFYFVCLKDNLFARTWRDWLP